MEWLSGVEDELSVFLGGLRVTTSLWCRAAMEPPWGVTVPRSAKPVLWVADRGTCWLEADGLAEPVRLASGDVAVLPHGPAHRLRDQPGSPIGADDIHQRSAAENRTELLCGDAVLGDPGTLLARLPTVLHLPREEAARTGAGSVARVLADRGPGSAALTARMTEELIIQAARHHLRRHRTGDHPPAGTDPAVVTALRLIREEPGRPWTVSELAARAALSRSGFASRFKEFTGEPPMRYLTRHRMSRAAACLREGDLPLRTIARLTGYDSEAALSRAFRRCFGVPPSTYRRLATNGQARKQSGTETVRHGNGQAGNGQDRSAQARNGPVGNGPVGNGQAGNGADRPTR